MRVTPPSIARFVVFLSALALLVLCVRGFAQERREVRKAPRFEGSTIPDPPRQREPWQPPATTLPKLLISASATLFDQGLADPRGCDYRAIEIAIGGVRSNGGWVMKTHGWVLPAPDGEKTRFAVAWSGLVYPTVSIGEPSDPAADVKVIDQEARLTREERAKHPSTGDVGFNGFGTNDEDSSVSSTSLHAIKVCLLLRLGRADLAEMVWAAGTDQARDVGNREAKAKLDQTSHGISYVSLANDLAWYLFDRAVCAHMRGDDALALADARKLTAFQKAVETQADGAGLGSSPKPHHGEGRHTTSRSSTSFPSCWPITSAGRGIRSDCPCRHRARSEEADRRPDRRPRPGRSPPVRPAGWRRPGRISSRQGTRRSRRRRRSAP